MSPQLRALLLSSLAVYGLPLIFGVVMLAAIGLPLPIVLVLLTAGALAQQKLFSLTGVISVGLLAAVIGDHLSYGIGWWGGRPLIRRISRDEALLQRALDTTERWGWWAVFLSRWLFTLLGSPCNWACGLLGYPLFAFFGADLAGKAIYVSVLVGLGYIFADRLEAMSALIGALSSWLFGGLLLVLVSWLIWKRWLKLKPLPSLRSPQ
jgi:membrane-associated protein